MFFSTPERLPSEKPSLRLVLYSAVVFPGIGQWQQRRLGAALVYGGSGAVASALFVAVLARCGSEMIRVMRGAWSWGIDPDEVRQVVGPVVQAGGFLLAVYAANLFDVWYAWYRRQRAWREGTSARNLESK